MKVKEQSGWVAKKKKKEELFTAGENREEREAQGVIGWEAKGGYLRGYFLETVKLFSQGHPAASPPLDKIPGILLYCILTVNGCGRPLLVPETSNTAIL